MQTKCTDILLSMLLALLAACSADNTPYVDVMGEIASGGKQLPLGFSFSNMDANTRMTATNAQISGNFLGINDLTLIPYDVSGDDNPIGPNDESLRTNLPLTANIGTDWSGPYRHWDQTYDHLVYNSVHVPTGTTSFLVYGHAPNPNKFANGSTLKSGYESGTQNYGHDAIQPKDIYFDPDPILTGNMDYSKAEAMVTYLNNILATRATYPNNRLYHSSSSSSYYTYSSYTDAPSSMRWNGADDGTYYYNNNIYTILTVPPALVTAYNNFTTNLNGVSCTPNNIKVALDALLNDISSPSYSSNSQSNTGLSTNARYNYGVYANLVTAIRTNIKQSGVTVNNANTVATVTNATFAGFPDDNLPDGICYIMYVNGAFTLVKSDTSINENTLNFRTIQPEKYAYPAQLWYYANTPIRTTDVVLSSEDMALLYNKQTWESVLTEFTFGHTVIPGVTGMALVEPLRYGTSVLELTVKAEASSMTDNNNASFALGSNFPLTGVFVGGQHRQLYNFTPATITNPLISYDNAVSGITLSTSVSSPNYTLVLPSAPEEVVYFVLEFQNNSNSTIIGVGDNTKKSRIPKGAKFYMVGLLDINEGTASAEVSAKKSAFLAGYKTTLLCKVKDFKAVYPVVPDVSDPMLVLGLQITSDWHSVTPGGAMLK